MSAWEQIGAASLIVSVLAFLGGWLYSLEDGLKRVAEGSLLGVAAACAVWALAALVIALWLLAAGIAQVLA